MSMPSARFTPGAWLWRARRRASLRTWHRGR